jgi:hypothetical protein
VAIAKRPFTRNSTLVQPSEEMRIFESRVAFESILLVALGSTSSPMLLVLLLLTSITLVALPLGIRLLLLEVLVLALVSPMRLLFL